MQLSKLRESGKGQVNFYNLFINIRYTWSMISPQHTQILDYFSNP